MVKFGKAKRHHKTHVNLFCLKENETNGRNILQMLTFVCCLFLSPAPRHFSLLSPPWSFLSSW